MNEATNPKGAPFASEREAWADGWADGFTAAAALLTDHSRGYDLYREGRDRFLRTVDGGARKETGDSDE